MDYIEITGYKSIHDERIELQPINILIGANGSGKSNFISFFDFLNRLYNQSITEYVALTGGVNRLLHKGQKNTNQLSFRLEFDNGINGYAATLKLGQDSFIFTNERLIYQGDQGTDISHYNTEAKIKVHSNFRAKYVMKYLEGFRKYHFHDTTPQSPFTNLSHIENDIYYLYHDGANLAAFLVEIQKKHPIYYNRIVKTIQSIAPYFLDFKLIPNQQHYVRLQWKDKFSDTLYGVADLSDGTMRFIALTVLFMQPKLPDTIIIDEPELGLHPSAITKLSGMIQSVAAKGCQVIIATQSTDLISHFEPENIITVDQINGASKFKRLQAAEFQEWLEEYTVDDLWKRNIITTGQPHH